MADKKWQFTFENEIKSHIKSQSFLPCYVLFGNEHYMIKKYVKDIISSAVSDFYDFNVSRFETGASLSSIADAVSALPMMSERRVVSVADFAVDSSDNASLIELVKDIPPSTILIFWFETTQIDTKKTPEKISKFFQAVCNAGGVVCNITRKSKAELSQLLQKGAFKRSCTIDSATAHYICDTCGDDLSTIINELEKLCHYVGENGKITKETVDKVCSRSVEASIYNVSKMLLRGDLTGAVNAVDDLLYMNTDPASILNILSSAYVDMYRAFAAKSVSQKSENIAKDFGYFNTAFRLSDADKNLRKFDEASLTKALAILSDADRKIKGAKIDSRVMLEKAITELAVLMGR